ncbi:MAG: class I SAM-dependent methyltransferase [candidate division Zixibacteria bacterium]|nr:class I SAM-dependent methyltransferase [candidate division Zixibacteria bacterium]
MYSNCPFCGSDKLEAVCHTDRIDKCLNCGHAFRQEIKPNISEGYRGKVSMPLTLDAIVFARHHYHFVEKHIAFENISSILEIGSGDGVMLDMISKRQPDIELYSVEPSKYHCRNLRKIPNVNVFEGYIEQAEFKRKFDLVVMSHVLEHIKIPHDIMKFIYDNLLETSGYLYIDIPNQDFELSSELIASAAPAGHLFFFNGGSFGKLLENVGFSKTDIIGSKYSITTPGYLNRIEKIASLKDSTGPFNRFNIYRLKALNRLSTMGYASYKFLAHNQPRELSLNHIDSRYNNMAIIARKSK